MKEFSEEDRNIVKFRMDKFGLTEIEVLSILSQLKEKDASRKAI
jgi:hypothetical protein